MGFEMFRAELERAMLRSGGTQGGRPAFDRVLMFKLLVLRAMYALSDERCERGDSAHLNSRSHCDRWRPAGFRLPRAAAAG